jgi:hypothetical protein
MDAVNKLQNLFNKLLLLRVRIWLQTFVFYASFLRRISFIPTSISNFFYDILFSHLTWSRPPIKKLSFTSSHRCWYSNAETNKSYKYIQS